ncbi:MAG: hypothetical protein QXL94_03850, partial [Candidatus Parvarchaeum sp.]
GIKIKFEPITRQPDLNILIYAFNYEGNTSLSMMNKFNDSILAQFGYEHKNEDGSKTDDSYKNNDVILAKNTFKRNQYGNAPINFLNRLGIDEKEWEGEGKVIVFRSVVMHPYNLMKTTLEQLYTNPIKESIAKALKELNVMSYKLRR